MVMSFYLPIKHLHMTLALLSIAGFIFRWALALQGSSWLQKRWIKVLPHIIDSFLLCAAIYLCWVLNQAPFYNHWLSAKLLWLVIYIGFGVFALKRAPTKLGKFICGIAAIASFSQIYKIAITHNAWGWLA
ncbi:SirB family protein [Alginatibacterium sediminis]|uniref:SirB family protein n=2 Tax=Alginatibacterium sediminis TaxID=2164068 RepID=A0A420ENL5_9ALTE|nr:SirB family protein [Alginatibacterium sediminis]